MSLISLRLPEELERLLNREAELASRPRSEIAREAIADYLARRERDRYIGEIARAARARDPAEARRMAEESLPLDNESLDLIEATEARQPKAAYRARKKTRR
jgi:metal-responsive CopG/Arc/MetJ family transcriptional regulator